MKQSKKIYTLTMARHLIDLGFEPIRTMPNPKDLHKDVWVFEQTPALEAACEAYIARRWKPDDVGDKTLSGLYRLSGMSVEQIMRLYRVDQGRVLNAIQNDPQLIKTFVYAAMSPKQRREYDTATTEDARARIMGEVGDFIVHASGKDRLFVGGKEVKE